MGHSYVQIQAKLMREYYKDFSKYAKGRAPTQKVAWVTAFTPVEILEALDIEYVYPESYAAVIAASGKEQEALQESERRLLCSDCCAYSGCYNGALALGTAPRGRPPKADVLIATNNQCDTLPNWWNLLSKEYNIPLIVLDYPGENFDKEKSRAYVTKQHLDLIYKMEKLSGKHLDEGKLAELIENSRQSVAAWKRVVEIFPTREIAPTTLFDGISHLITSRCKAETAEVYTALAEELESLPPVDLSNKPLFWLGYPLWYHPKRFLEELLSGFRICGSNYITWWSLDYNGTDAMEQLFQAYNYTFLNLKSETKRIRLHECIKESGAIGAISLRNKSCKCDMVSARYIDIPQVELEIDMIDRNYIDMDYARRQIETLWEII